MYGYNTDILGCVVERASGVPLDEFVAARITEQAEPGTVCVSAETWARAGITGDAHSLGAVDIKGKGDLNLVEIHSL